MSKVYSFKTGTFLVDNALSDFFSRNLDSNPVHLDGNSNELLPAGTASGLFVMALASKHLLYLPEFKEVLAAKSMNIKFMRPTFRGQHLYTEGTYTEAPHAKREGVIERISDCRVICVETEKMVIQYEVVQLLRAKPKS